MVVLQYLEGDSGTDVSVFFPIQNLCKLMPTCPRCSTILRAAFEGKAQLLKAFPASLQTAGPEAACCTPGPTCLRSWPRCWGPAVLRCSRLSPARWESAGSHFQVQPLPLIGRKRNLIRAREGVPRGGDRCLGLRNDAVRTALHYPLRFRSSFSPLTNGASPEIWWGRLKFNDDFCSQDTFVRRH